MQFDGDNFNKQEELTISGTRQQQSFEIDLPLLKKWSIDKTVFENVHTVVVNSRNDVYLSIYAI